MWCVIDYCSTYITIYTIGIDFYGESRHIQISNSDDALAMSRETGWLN